MTAAYIILFLFLIYFVVLVLSRKQFDNIPVAFAGAYNGTDTTMKISKSRNPVIYTEGDKPIDLDNFTRYIISGKSLEKLGIENGMFVYTVPPLDELSLLTDRFVVFRYDNDRLAVEHPEIKNPVDSFKARKVIDIIPTAISYGQFEKLIYPTLSADNEIKDKDECLKCLWEKYSFASGFYSEDKSLIISVTYKDNGTRKDYSFHSPRFLEGIIRYKSVAA